MQVKGISQDKQRARTWNSFWAHSGRSAKLTPPPSKTVAVSGTLEKVIEVIKCYKISVLPVDFPPQVLKECREPGLAGGLAATRASSQNQFPYFSFFLLSLQRKHDMKPYLLVSFTQIAAAVSSVYTALTRSKIQAFCI